jgi:hypothetical protein
MTTESVAGVSVGTVDALDVIEREILEIERHAQLLAVRCHRLESKLTEAKADVQIVDMALNRYLSLYRDLVPHAPVGRDELLAWIEGGTDD